MIVKTHFLKTRTAYWNLSCAMVASLLVGCATANGPERSIRANALPGQAASDSVHAVESLSDSETAADNLADRKIEPSDTLIIDVYGEKDFTARESRVQSSGIIILPLANFVRVAGLTTSEASELIAKRLSKYIIDPQVSVDVKEYRMRTVSVMGQVEKAGLVKMPLEEKMDIIEAIAEAGGFSRTANKGKIDLTHKGKTKTYSFDELKKEQDPRKKVWLQPGDVIYVHESFI